MVTKAFPYRAFKIWDYVVQGKLMGTKRPQILATLFDLLFVLFLLQEQYMLIHDAIAEFILTKGETEIKDVDISKYVSDLTRQINGEITPLQIQYNVSKVENQHKISYCV